MDLDTPAPYTPPNGFNFETELQRAVSALAEAGRAWAAATVDGAAKKIAATSHRAARSAGVDPPVAASLSPPFPSEIRAEMEKKLSLKFIQRVARQLFQIGTELDDGFDGAGVDVEIAIDAREAGYEILSAHFAAARGDAEAVEEQVSDTKREMSGQLKPGSIEVLADPNAKVEDMPHPIPAEFYRATGVGAYVPKGTVVQINGMPFELGEETLLWSGAPSSWENAGFTLIVQRRPYERHRKQYAIPGTGGPCAAPKGDEK